MLAVLHVARMRKTGIKIASSVSVCVCVCVCVCVFLSPRLLITNGVIWTPYDQLSNFYSFYMAAVVGIMIISRLGLSIDRHHRNQPI